MSSQEEAQENELLAYEMEIALRYDGGDPLSWWFDRRQKMPRMFTLAMRVLSAQATEVPCERLFSSAGRIFTDSRQSMHPETLAKHLFINANHAQLQQDRSDARVKRHSSDEDSDA